MTTVQVYPTQKLKNHVGYVTVNGNRYRCPLYYDRPFSIPVSDAEKLVEWGYYSYERNPVVPQEEVPTVSQPVPEQEIIPLQAESSPMSQTSVEELIVETPQEPEWKQKAYTFLKETATLDDLKEIESIGDSGAKTILNRRKTAGDYNQFVSGLSGQRQSALETYFSSKVFTDGEYETSEA